MISKLTYDQIADIWPVIKDGIQNDLEISIFGRYKYRESIILESMLSGAIEVWMSYEKNEEEDSIVLYTISLTSVYTDPCTRNRTLYIFSILWYRDPPDDYLSELRSTLTKYAKWRGCHTMTGITNREELVKMANTLGVDTSFTLLQVDLEKE